MNINESNKFTFEDLDNWGLLLKAKIEHKKDIILKKESMPNKKDLQNIEINWREKYKLSKEEDFKIWLEKANLTKERLIYLLTRNWKWLNWCKREFEKQIPDYFIKKKSFIDNVTYSLISLKDKDIADELYIRIKEEEEPFWLVSKKYSQGPERNYDGRIGPIPLAKLNPYLRNLLIISNEGQMWPPRKIENFWIIVKLEKKFNTSLNSQISEEISLELGEKYLNDLILDTKNKKNIYE